jgi:hypothetical protein
MASYIAGVGRVTVSLRKSTEINAAFGCIWLFMCVLGNSGNTATGAGGVRSRPLRLAVHAPIAGT